MKATLNTLTGIILLCFYACRSSEALVDAHFIDSVLAHYQTSVAARVNEGDLQFWKRRVDSLPESFVNQQKFAMALAGRFHFFGDIRDLKQADSIMQGLAYRYREPGFFLSLAGYKMLQHRFTEARALIDTVVQTKAEPFAVQMMLFDANFELGNYFDAMAILKRTASPRDYAYNFRLSKMEHYEGSVDSAIAHMQKAASLASANPYLEQAALSNAGDLYIHDGELSKAVKIYEHCVRLNPSDFHSLMGLAWIALVHDNNPSLASKVFNFVNRQIKSPDPLLKLSQAAELTQPAQAKEYALAFVHIASDPSYGAMYNKYLVQLYTGILNDPQKALSLAQNEISNRATPQTYAWLAWSLFRADRKEEAYAVFQQHVSGKGLEGLELYWMGKLMKGMDKGYNAAQFFHAARQNLYDLSPAEQKDLASMEK